MSLPLGHTDEQASSGRRAKSSVKLDSELILIRKTGPISSFMDWLSTRYNRPKLFVNGM